MVKSEKKTCTHFGNKPLGEYQFLVRIPLESKKDLVLQNYNWPRIGLKFVVFFRNFWPFTVSHFDL